MKKIIVTTLILAILMISLPQNALALRPVAYKISLHREARAKIKYAVKAAVSGRSGCMVSINRISNDQYKFELSDVPLEKVANVEKKFPLEWINESGNGIKEAFIPYLEPLVGGSFPEYAKLKSDFIW